MSSHSSNQNLDQHDNVPADPIRSPGVQPDDNVPVPPPEPQGVEPPNDNVPVNQLQRPDQLQVLVNAPDLQVDDNIAGACAPMDARQPAGSGSNSSEGSGSSPSVRFEDYLPHMVNMSLSLTSSSPATSSTLGSSKTPTLSTDQEERSSLTGTPSSEGSGEGALPALTSEQMIREIVQRLPDGDKQKPKDESRAKMDEDQRRETPEGSAGETKEAKPAHASRVEAPVSNVPRLPPLPKPAALPAPLEVQRPQQRASSLPPLPGAKALPSHEIKSSVVVLPPVAGATGARRSQSREIESPETSKQSSEAEDSSFSSSSRSVRSESPKKPANSKVEELRRRDSSDGSKADESSVSIGSPQLHKKKALHKKIPKDSTGTTPTPKAIRGELPVLSRADTLDDVETIKTDSISFRSSPSPFTRPLSPDRDRRAISLPADPPIKDPKMAPHDRRAFSEAKAQDMEIIPVPPNQSLETSISWSEPVDPPQEVRSEPVRRVTERVVPSLRAISEGHPLEDPPSSVYSPVVPVDCMEEEQPSEVAAYAGDRSSSNSDVDPMRERPRREDREADRQMREFNQALEEAARVSSGRGTDSNAPSTTLGTSSENRVAPLVEGYASWLQGAENVGDGSSQSTSDQSSSGSSNLQVFKGWFAAGSRDQSEAGPSGVGKTPAGGMDTLSVIPEKRESLSPSSMSESTSPIEMDVSSPKPAEGEDSAKDRGESSNIPDVEKKTLDQKSHLVVKLEETAPRTPKRKREPKKSTDDSPKDPELLSPGEDSKKKYCSEFSRPVMTHKIARSSSTGSVKPDQVQRVDIASLKELADKRVAEVRKSTSSGAESSEESEKSPKDESSGKDSEDKREPSA